MKVQGCLGVKVTTSLGGGTWATGRKDEYNLENEKQFYLQSVLNDIIGTIRVPVTIMVPDPSTWMVCTGGLGLSFNLRKQNCEFLIFVYLRSKLNS